MTMQMRVTTLVSMHRPARSAPVMQVKSPEALRVALENRVAANPSCQRLDVLDALFSESPTTR